MSWNVIGSGSTIPTTVVDTILGKSSFRRLTNHPDLFTYLTSALKWNPKVSNGHLQKAYFPYCFISYVDGQNQLHRASRLVVG